MHIHNALGKLFSQIVLHFRGNVVCFRHRNVGVNLDVEVEHKHHAVAAGAQLVKRNHAGCGGDAAPRLGVDFFGQRHFEQVFHGRNTDFHCHKGDKHAHQHCHERVENHPFVAQEHGAAYANEGGNTGVGIAAMMPRIGNHCRTVEAFAHARSVAKQSLFRHNRHQCHHQRYHSG